MAPLILSRTPISSVLATPVLAEDALVRAMPRARVGFARGVYGILGEPHLAETILESISSETCIVYHPEDWFHPDIMYSLSDAQRSFADDWHVGNLAEIEKYRAFLEAHNIEDYDDALVSVFAGLGLSTLLALLADASGVRVEGGGAMGEAVEGVVRWVGGNSDTLSLVVRAIVRKLQGKPADKADRFGRFALFGTFAGPGLHALYDVGGDANAAVRALYGSAYANADNLAGGVEGLVSSVREHGLRDGWRRFTMDTFQMWNLGIITANAALNLLLHAGLLRQDWVGSNIGATLETAALNTDTLFALLRVRLLNIREARRVSDFAADPARLATLAREHGIDPSPWEGKSA